MDTVSVGDSTKVATMYPAPGLVATGIAITTTIITAQDMEASMLGMLRGTLQDTVEVMEVPVARTKRLRAVLHAA